MTTKNATAAQMTKVIKLINAELCYPTAALPVEWDDGRKLITIESSGLGSFEISNLIYDKLPKNVWLEPVNNGLLAVYRETSS
jgi:hypothetical protein